MNITHVVTYVSRDGAYGGPLSVAVAQARLLTTARHEVTIIAGSDGTSLSLPGVKTLLAPATRVGKSFFGVVAPGVWRRVFRTRRLEVFHLHLGRDLVGLASGLILSASRSRFVVQTHGMVRPDSRLLVRVVDRIATRTILANAQYWLVLDDREERDLSRLLPPRLGQAIRVHNAIDMPLPGVRRSHRRPMVSFVARLHPRKNVIAFATAAAQMLSDGVDADFEIWGPDEGDLKELTELIARVGSPRLSYRGALAPGQAPAVLDASDVYVLPSVGEVFPMTVLEAIAGRAALVVPSDCDMTRHLGEQGAALLTTSEPEDIAERVGRLVGDGEMREALASRALEVLERDWSQGSLLEALENAYR